LSLLVCADVGDEPIKQRCAIPLFGRHRPAMLSGVVHKTGKPSLAWLLRALIPH